MVHNVTQVAVPTVSPVDCATPCKQTNKLEFDIKNSYLRLEDNSSKSFEVHK